MNDKMPIFQVRSVDNNGNPSPLNKPYEDDSVYIESKSEMSLRDWFAAMAMQGLLANSFYANENRQKGFGTPDELARAAFANADAMLAERYKKTQ